MTDLFGDAPEPAPKKARKARPESDGSTARVEEAYVAGFQQRFGFKPRISFGRDRKHLKDLVATWGEPEVVALLGEFFSTTEPRVTACYQPDYSIPHFFRVAQLIKLRANGSRPAERRTAANLDAVARAIGARRQP